MQKGLGKPTREGQEGNHGRHLGSYSKISNGG